MKVKITKGQIMAAEEMTMLSISRTLHTKIKALAEQDGRSMRAFVAKLIEEAEKKKK